MILSIIDSSLPFKKIKPFLSHKFDKKIFFNSPLKIKQTNLFLHEDWIHLKSPLEVISFLQENYLKYKDILIFSDDRGFTSTIDFIKKKKKIVLYTSNTDFISSAKTIFI